MSLVPSIGQFSRRWRLRFQLNILDRAFRLSLFTSISGFGLFRSKRPFPGKCPGLSLCRVTLPLMQRGTLLADSAGWEGLILTTVPTAFRQSLEL